MFISLVLKSIISDDRLFSQSSKIALESKIDTVENAINLYEESALKEVNRLKKEEKMMMIRAIGGGVLLMLSGSWVYAASSVIFEKEIVSLLTIANIVISLLAMAGSTIIFFPTNGQIPNDRIDNWLHKRVTVKEETSLEVCEKMRKSLV